MHALKHREGIPLIAALAMVLACVAWAWWRASHIFPLATLDPRGGRMGDHYEPVHWDHATMQAEEWSTPMAQTAGPDWTFEVFAPPAISYDVAKSEYIVTSPNADRTGAEENSGLGVDPVIEEPFPLKLVGFLGSEGRYFGTFENVRSKEHFLARAGQHLPALGLAIKQFEVRKEGLDLPGGMGFGGLIATAVVRDSQTGAETILTDRVRGPAERADDAVDGLGGLKSDEDAPARNADVNPVESRDPARARGIGPDANDALPADRKTFDPQS
jgi:hypothetical protein